MGCRLLRPFTEARLELFGERDRSVLLDESGTLVEATGPRRVLEVDVEHNLLGLRLDGGEDRFDAWSRGGYWTHFGPSGWYLDGFV